MADDPRDAATWGLINAADDEADSDAQKLAALAPWIQQLTEIMTTIEPTDEPGGADPGHHARIDVIWQPSASVGEFAAVDSVLKTTSDRLVDLLAQWGVTEATVRLDMYVAERRALVGIAGSATHDRPAAPTREHASDCLHDEPGVTICTCRPAVARDRLHAKVSSVIGQLEAEVARYEDGSEAARLAWLDACDELTDAMLELLLAEFGAALSRSAAEPPAFDPATFELFATTADPTALADLLEQATGHRPESITVGVAAEPHEQQRSDAVNLRVLAAGIARGRPLEDGWPEKLREIAERLFAEADDADGVAAGPNEEHGDGR